MNVYSLFRERSQSGSAFIVSPTNETLYSYDDLETCTARLANGLVSIGVSPGDRVIVQVEKSPMCLMLYFACLRIGAVYLPLNTAYLDDELKFFVSDAEPVLIVCDPAKEAFFASLSDATVMTLDGNGEGTLTNKTIDKTNGEETFQTVDVAGDHTAAILYTSGTTGRPKGAMISHDNLATNGMALHEAWGWCEGDVMLHALPIFHVHGLFVASNLPVLNASPIIFLDGFNPEVIIDCLPRSTVYMGVPTNYTRLLATGKLSKDVCSNMRLFTSGSAPLLPQTFNEFAETTGHQIVERYGMTETGMNTSNPLDGARKPGTVGPPLRGVAVKILDDDGNELGVQEPGNLLVQGSNVFKGYWKLPEKTAEEFDGDYFRTGDIATIDEDGYVSIVGRNKDMIISGGLNVYPKEIEETIDKLDGVDESAVIGLPHPDFGEGVCAVIVSKPGSEISEEQVVAELKSKLANFKVPKWVYFVDALPRNTMGKVQKNLLREEYGSS